MPAFEPPGPGWWTLDTAHFPRPATPFVAEIFSEPARRGFAEATERYGLLMDHIEWAFVNGWAYLSPRPAVRPPATREEWDDLLTSDRRVRQRESRSANVFVDKSWREDVRTWDTRTKPAMATAHRGLQAVDPTALPDPALIDHLDRCRDNLRRGIFEHHRLNIGPVLPVGDFLASARDWTECSDAELLTLVRSDGPPEMAGGAELRRLADAVNGDANASATLVSGDDPRAVLAALTALPGYVGVTAAAYLDLVGCWSAGGWFDVGEPCLSEMPQVLLATIRAAAAGEASVDAAARRSHETDALAAVPADRRQAFDNLLTEARATHRLRDERSVYCDVWAFGLARRAIMAGGQRLADAGAIAEPEHLLEASYDEMRALIASGAAPPPGDELARRAHERQTARAADAPEMLGRPSASPVPLGWLLTGARRTERAFRTYMGAMSGEDRRDGGGAVAGTAASAGRYQGRARVIRTAADLGRIERGDVLVTGSTTPVLSSVLPLLGAIVTDRGGLLSHAAIVAREFGIPAVVGTEDATTKIRDGALVLVDGTTGQVTPASASY